MTPLPLPLERRRAAALGGGGRAGRDGDAVDMIDPTFSHYEATVNTPQYDNAVLL